MFHIATVIVAVLASTAVAATSNDKRIVARNADDSIAVSRSGDVYVCSRNAGPCGGTDVVCPPPSKRDCAAVLGARDDARMIAVAARCDGGNCKHPSS
ncbi:hypothetical protein LMH87_006729 [Akanthomyces muscarius]|uniref:Uncharacterized protein n=1 Tax=Akanthomyces muscarius TaxID=2231603 RepID=A0A9W8UQL7_AKAMU|nr:hypothetical protein LMH87_006729 [Akanthomyces muscarius]KAJ4165082.1 hypothetical protein LMH87_006729 [Akanthomyces muscarius]